MQVDIPPGVMREGREFQAQIPLQVSEYPPGREQDNPHAGLPGPSTLEALAIAAGFEKDASDSLHIDAIADPEYHPGQGCRPQHLRDQTLEGPPDCALSAAVASMMNMMLAIIKWARLIFHALSHNMVLLISFGTGKEDMTSESLGS